MHMEKYKREAVSGVTKHNARVWEGRGFERENIDNSKLGLDWSLGPDRGDAAAWVEARIGELNLKRAPRRDAVRMCEWVVPCPQDVTPDEEPRFFRAAYGAMEGEYGAENVVGAWVHRDEPGARTHMHFDFVPVTPDGRLSAKEIMSRAHLREMYPLVQAAAEEALGHQVSVLLPDEERGERAARYVDLPEYKAATEAAREARERAERAAAEADEAEGRAKALRGEIGALERRKADIGFASAQAQMRKEDEDRALKELRAQVAGAKAELARCESDAADAERAAKDARADLATVTARRDAVAADLAAVRAGLADARAERDRVTKDRDAARRERDKAIAARDAAKNSQAKAEGRAKEAEERLARIQSQVAQAKEDLARLRAEIEKVISRAKAIFREWWVSLEYEPPIEDMAREAASSITDALRDYGYVDDTSHEER